ncbi:MAG: phosphoglycolate phosphatase [Alphaproteobacteria bacterium]|nr:phosphoglycolate phosphatase [Alphaproteobacteria bacterium]
MSRDAILFDLDGTLVDSAPDLHQSLNFVLARLGRPAIQLDEVRAMVGDGVRVLLERSLAATGGGIESARFEQAMADYLVHYEAHLADLSRPFPAVAETLARLRAAGKRLAVCTNKPHAFSVSLLRQLGLADHFDAVLGGDSLPVRKPDPGHLLGTLAAIGREPPQAVMIGDSRNDVAAARNAGVPVIAVSFGYTVTPPRELGADLVIDHFDELAGALDRLS